MHRRLIRNIGAAICLAALSACGSRDQPDGWICVTLPNLTVDALLQLNPRERLNRCVLKWGYRLSRAPDPARTIADATVAACSDLLLGAQQFRLSEWNDNATRMNADALKLEEKTGRAMVRMPMAEEVEPEGSLEQEVLEQTKGQALLAVVQSRAGRCKVPEVL